MVLHSILRTNYLIVTSAKGDISLFESQTKHLTLLSVSYPASDTSISFPESDILSLPKMPPVQKLTYYSHKPPV